MNLDLKLFYRIAFWISLTGLIAIISNFGFSQTDISQLLLDSFYFIVLGIGIISTLARYIQNPKLFKRKVFVFDLLSIAFTLWIFYMYLFVGVPDRKSVV